MRRNVTEKNVRDRALKDCKKAGVEPLAAMYVRSGFFIPRASCKSPRERMCPGAMPGGVRGARWAQIDAIARANVPCRPLERRLPCQMICGKAWNRALTAVRGRLGFFLQITARANVPWSDAWRGLRCSMDTNRCHRASRCAMQAPRKAIAVPGDLQERGCRTCTAVRGSSAIFQQIIARADVPWSDARRGLLCSMDTNRCHRASRYALQTPRKAIAVSDELQESADTGSPAA